MNIDIDLNKIVCDTFQRAFQDIVECRVSEVVLKGGRDSTKSQCITEAVLVGCMIYKQSALGIVKYQNKIRERLVDTFVQSARYLGVEKYWRLRKSPYEYVLLDKYGKETDVSIRFTGCDNPDILKGFKPRAGSFRYFIFEELTNFKTKDELVTALDTANRGEGTSCAIMTFNPPRSRSHWINKEYNVPCGKALGYKSNYYYTTVEKRIEGSNETFKIKRLVHHSSYLDVLDAGHISWFKPSWLVAVQESKENNNKWYRWNYLGECIGDDLNVFWNIHDWKYDDSVIKSFNLLFRGMDNSHGGADPFHFGTWYYDKSKHDLYCINELRVFSSAKENKTCYEALVSGVKKLNINNRFFYIDSSVPDIARTLNSMGLNAIPVKKTRAIGKDNGIIWLQSLNHIYIDSIKTPYTYQEFKEYEYEVNKYNQPTNDVKDGNDHSIDTCRYALCEKMYDNEYIRNIVNKNNI